MVQRLLNENIIGGEYLGRKQKQSHSETYQMLLTHENQPLGCAVHSQTDL